MFTCTIRRFVNRLCLVSSLAMLLVVQTLAAPLAGAATDRFDFRSPYLASLPATGGEASSPVLLLVAWTLLASVFAIGGLNLWRRRRSATERIAQNGASHSRLVAIQNQRGRSAD